MKNIKILVGNSSETDNSNITNMCQRISSETLYSRKKPKKRTISIYKIQLLYLTADISDCVVKSTPHHAE
jgi:hypothetical protein